MRSKNDITIIRGDILELYFILENISAEAIEKVFFTCAEQKIQVECPYSQTEEGYCLRLESTDTAALLPLTSRYDITVRFTDGNDFTAVYEGLFAVCEKNNKVVGV